MAICLGPTGSGKTLLLKKLQNPNNIDNTTTTGPTIGTNLFTIKSNDKKIDIRELGGSISPLWHRYYNNTIEKIIYTVDASNLCQISAAGVLFYSILANPILNKAQILLVLTKMDLSYRQMRNEALLMLQISKIHNQINQRLKIMETSAITGTGRQEILDWLWKK